MRHKTAVRLDDGWHYAITSRRGGSPLGYCANHAPHPTEAEARECYGRYVREQTIHLNTSTNCSWTSCAARPDGKRCPNPTQAYATYGDDGYGITPLCPEHMTAEHVIECGHLAGPAGDAWIS